MKHSISFSVYYEDTDAAGIVYHANYLKFAERARTEWLRELGFEQWKMIQENLGICVVYRLEIEYHIPARLDDLLTVETQLSECKKASMKMLQKIQRGADTLATLNVYLACVNHKGKPIGWPAAFFTAFSRLVSN